MKEKTLVIFLDAVREDYITKENTPFLYDFKNQNTYLDLISLLGYSCGIHPSIFSGQNQEDLGKFLVYSYDPKNSGFKWFKYLNFLPSKIRQYIIGSLKAPYYMLPIPKKWFPKWYKKGILPLPASIDPKMAGNFKIEDMSFKNYFLEILKENNISYSSQVDNDNDNYGKGIGLQNFSNTDNQVDFYFSRSVDGLGHYPGPNSNRLLEQMREYDQLIEKIYKDAKNKNEKVNMFIFSDHGMEEIVGSVNIKEILDKSNLEAGKDYKVFYDSTMVRFWIEKDEIKKEIINLLKGVENINYLDDNLKEKYKIRFNDRKWGDLFFLADNGYRIFPDYFSPVRFNTKGMHGYFPEATKEAKGVFISNAFKSEKKEINIVDILPTLLKSLGLEHKIPKECKGKSIY